MTLAPPQLVEITTSVVYLLHATERDGDPPSRGVGRASNGPTTLRETMSSTWRVSCPDGQTASTLVSPLVWPVATIPYSCPSASPGCRRSGAGTRTTRLRDLIATGDPRRPRPRQQGLIMRSDPSRATVVCGEPASVSDLHQAFVQTSAHASDVGGFTGFVTRRATLALERAESHRLGPQYKVPRLVREEIWSSARFSEGLARLARAARRPEQEVSEEAGRCLDEMVAGYGRSQLDLALQLGRLMYRQGYEETIDYDRDEADRVARAARHHAAVLLPTHRSNLDAGVMPTAWHELGLPPTHTLAGINMAFWPLGPIMRRSGSIFIRRDIKDDPVYRFVLASTSAIWSRSASIWSGTSRAAGREPASCSHLAGPAHLRHRHVPRGPHR